MTGADSPVMALSSTEAAPMTISPSAGICSFALTKNRSFLFRMAEFVSSAWMRKNSAGSSAWWPFATRPSFSLWASTSRFAARRASACALPRPSARASAKFANSTVSHSTTEMARMKPGAASAMPNSDRTNKTSVKTADRYTMNITGFFACSRGASFTNESRTARLASALIAASPREPEPP